MSFFQWLDSDDSTTQACSKEQRLTLEEQLRNMTARRKILNQRIEKAMLHIQQMEIEQGRVSHLEDALMDDLEKLPR